MVDESLLLLLQSLQHDVSKISERTLTLQEKAAATESEIGSLRKTVDSLEKCIVRGNGQPSLTKVVNQNTSRIEKLESEAVNGRASRRWLWTAAISALSLVVAAAALVVG